MKQIRNNEAKVPNRNKRPGTSSPTTSSPTHRSSDCRATGRKVNLTLKEDEYDEEEKNNVDSDGEEYDADMCHHESGNVDGEYTTQSCVIRHSGSIENIVSRDIVQRLKLPTKKHPNLYRIRLIKSVGEINEFDVNATHKGKDNTYSFRVNGVKNILVPLIENSKPKVLEEKRNNLMIMSHRDFEDEIKGELVIYAVVARGMIQECC
ncbi:hypothetical protein Tco_0608356 [Tanacetum coccineum]